MNFLPECTTKTSMSIEPVIWRTTPSMLGERKLPHGFYVKVPRLGFQKPHVLLTSLYRYGGRKCCRYICHPRRCRPCPRCRSSMTDQNYSDRSSWRGQWPQTQTEDKVEHLQQAMVCLLGFNGSLTAMVIQTHVSRETKTDKEKRSEKFRNKGRDTIS